METVCEWFDLKITRTVSSGLASKPAATVFTGFALKPVAMVSSGLTSKPVATVFSGLALKSVAVVFSSLASKLVATVSLGLTSKLRWWRVSRFGPQNQQLWFGDLGLKITATVSWFESQKQAGFGLSVVPQNQRREVSARHASRSSGLLHVEASLARVSQSGIKINKGVTAGGASGTIMEVASEAS
jgi:hypothetical protein